MSEILPTTRYKYFCITLFKCKLGDITNNPPLVPQKDDHEHVLLGGQSTTTNDILG